ncbi:hypothetical protein CNMCM5793_009621 [Aspergillus hiratsukae]|uniref:Uncharacterized protein n=1 Tax=Aspergillus hiratsukae TaxID=1194566 RepID=A0A8H6Q957_9EURO|nr:hypothetical protein CNMCM5793_009621 [Aspergillus hiratsukae]KAF7168698.1 hypothetical protein CNMCM6106_003816 [Aspergillus hiratsukae]
MFVAGPSRAMEAPRPATNFELYSATPDKATSNAVHLQCTITRARYVPKFGTQSYTTIVDGVVLSRRTGEVQAILEVKPVRRFLKPAPVQMQEMAEAVGWLQRQTSGVPQLQNQSRLIIYKGQDEIYLTLMAPGTRYVEYLGRTTPTTTADPQEFVTMNPFGPWHIQDEPHLRSLFSVLLAFLSAAVEVAA